MNIIWSWKKFFLNFARYVILFVLAVVISYLSIGPFFSLYKNIFGLSGGSGFASGFLEIGLWVMLVPFFTSLLFLFSGEKKWKYWWVGGFTLLLLLLSFDKNNIGFTLTFVVTPIVFALLVWFLIQGIKKIIKKYNRK